MALDGDKGRTALIRLKENRYRSAARLVRPALPILAAALIGLSFLSPVLAPGNNIDDNLKRMRSRAAEIRSEFKRILEEADARTARLEKGEIPEDHRALYSRMRDLCSDPERTGIGLYSEDRRLLLWFGEIVDLEPLFELESRSLQERKTVFTLLSGAKVHLVAIHPLPSGEFMALHRLLAFLPQFRTQYLRDYHFLSERRLRNGRINYWDFRDDVSGFERVFQKHSDEYIGQPNLQDEIQTLFFPLRTGDGRIAATVTLGSPSLASLSHERAEKLRLAGYLLLLAFLAAVAVAPFKSLPASSRLRTWIPLLILIDIFGMRFLAVLIGRLTMVSKLSIFSPASAGFLSFAGLTGSPADIFLTLLSLFLAIGALVSAYSSRIRFRPTSSRGAGTAAVAGWMVITIGLFFLLREISKTLVRNSGLDLLRPVLQPEYILVQMAVLLSIMTVILLSLTTADALSPLMKGKSRLNTKGGDRNGFTGLLFLAALITVFATIHSESVRKDRRLLEETLTTSLESQEDWAFFLLDEAVPEIEKQKDAIQSLLRAAIPGDLAKNLWRRTLLSRMNWYSSLEILSPDGEPLSRFSLNIPEPYRPALDLPMSPEWVTLEQTITYLGKDRDFIVTYRDWIQDGLHLGRLVLSVAVDYKMLPFLFSSTPYFELMRISTISSFKQKEFKFAVFDLGGHILFDPDKMAIGVPLDFLQDILSGINVRHRFPARGKTYSGLFSRYKNRIFALFRPLRNPLGLATDFFKLLTIHISALLAVLLAFALVRGRTGWQNPFWSYSNRVYFSFVAVALIPLLLFTFSTQSFFDRIFTQKITEEAEMLAGFAQRMMAEIILLQQEEQVSLTIDPDRILLWISTTIDNDVNLYLDGRIISSSRREFFDAGLLPELIDGELYYRFRHENTPFVTRTEKIGGYSYHTLALPYSFQEAMLLISLPFPLEQEEISKSTAELLEFLFFLSFLFIAAVLAFARGMSGMIVKPIRKLLVATREVSLGNLEVRIHHRRRDEMRNLIDGFNAMVLSMRQHQQEVADLSKKAAWAEMARKVAHEIKNPLTPIQLSAEHLQRVYAERPEEFRAALEKSTSYIVKEVENLRQIAQQFLERSKQPALIKRPFDLGDMIRETLEPYHTTLAERIDIRLSLSGDDFRLRGDRAKLKIVLRNLLTNAIESIRGRGTIDIRLTAGENDIRLEIEDSGEGMDQNLLDHIFEPDFSTKEGGTGLGLPIAKKIVEDHGGTIRGTPNRPRGFRFEIFLPRGEKNPP